MRGYAANPQLNWVGGPLDGTYNGLDNIHAAWWRRGSDMRAWMFGIMHNLHVVEIGADQEEQLVAWLSKRIGTPIRPPRLGKLGYELIGGRLLPGESGPVAQFMYHDATGQRLTLYVSTEQTHNKDTGFRFAQEGSVNVFYWIDGKFGYALSAGMNKGELARVASVVYEQIEKP